VVDDGCQSAAALAELPPGIWLSLRYEDLLSDPETELTRLAEFLEVPVTAQWLAAGKFVNQRRAGQSAELAPEALAELTMVWQPGTEAIAVLEAQRAAVAGSPS